jgi:lipopolysaccharide export system protein LptA
MLLLLAAVLARAESPLPNAAGSVVRSKQWIVRRGKKPEEEFVGDVRYEASGARMTADWALFRHWADDWRARGRVYLRRELERGDVIEGRGETATYDHKTESGTLSPAKSLLLDFTRTPPEGGEPDRGVGARMTWEGRETATLDGAVHVWGPRTEFRADRARYDSVPQRVTLTGGRPVLRRVEGPNPGAMKADVIVGYDDPRRLVATGRAVGWIVLTDTSTLQGLSK